MAAYADLYTALAAKALPPDDSADLLARIRGDLKEPAPPKAITTGTPSPAPSPFPTGHRTTPTPAAE